MYPLAKSATVQLLTSLTTLVFAGLIYRQVLINKIYPILKTLITWLAAFEFASLLLSIESYLRFHYLFNSSPFSIIFFGLIMSVVTFSLLAMFGELTKVYWSTALQLSEF